MIYTALTIAGSDPSGGAGIQADLKTFHQFQVYGQAVITLLTVQNTQKVQAVLSIEADFVGAQLDAVLEDIPPAAVKTGALGNQAIIEVISTRKLANLVIDPVMISKHGAPLMEESAQQALIQLLFPKALLVTPNLPEAAAICGTARPPKDAARQIHDLGARNVLIKGGHQTGNTATDLLLMDGQFMEFSAARIQTHHTHGTGCTFSAAITALLARGTALPKAVEIAKGWITEAIKTNPGLGKGSGPVNHFSAINKQDSAYLREDS